MALTFKGEIIWNYLDELERLGHAFNSMVGSLYSGICADEINNIINILKEQYNVKVSWYQPIPGRVEFSNLIELKKEYLKYC